MARPSKWQTETTAIRVPKFLANKKRHEPLPTPSKIYSLTIMTRKPNKLEVVEPNFNVGDSQDSQDSLSIDASEKLTLEEIVADELLDSLDWKVVKKALLKAVRRKFIRWFVSGSASMIATNEIEAEALAIGSGEEEAAA